jgi:hypothetical protein
MNQAISVTSVPVPRFARFVWITFLRTYGLNGLMGQPANHFIQLRLVNYIS